jgi:PIN domain nuclease of toxin-antitoxin system
MAKILDSSALLAFLLNEPGSERVAPHVPGGIMSAVNVSEVLLVLVRGGVPLEAAELALRKTQVAIIDFTFEHAALATRIVIGDNEFRSRAISFGDRACMASALQRGLAVITADRAWEGLKIDGLQVDFIR